MGAAEAGSRDALPPKSSVLGFPVDHLLIAVHRAATAVDPARGGPLRTELVVINSIVPLRDDPPRYRLTLYRRSNATGGLDMPVFSMAARPRELGEAVLEAWRALCQWGVA